MMLSQECCGVVILAGGRSRRMGTCKALLTIEGETMLSRLTRQLDDFQEKLLSTNTPALAEGLPLKPVPDIYPGAGPLAGLLFLGAVCFSAFPVTCQISFQHCHGS